MSYVPRPGQSGRTGTVGEVASRPPLLSLCPSSVAHSACLPALRDSPPAPSGQEVSFV